MRYHLIFIRLDKNVKFKYHSLKIRCKSWTHCHIRVIPAMKEAEAAGFQAQITHGQLRETLSQKKVGGDIAQCKSL